jgi:hypothetical protein
MGIVELRGFAPIGIPKNCRNSETFLLDEWMMG